LRRWQGQESEAWIELLIQCTMSRDGVAKLQRLNPFLSATEAEDVMQMCILGMLAGSRSAQAARCLTAAQDLLSFMSDAWTRAASSAAVDEQRASALSLKSKKLASMLFESRHYFDVRDDGSASFDPRMLAFEFIHSIVLRRSQVQLLDEFKDRIRDGASTCHQMLMGSGKTTVIAPLLALLLGNQDVLTTQVVPRALLQFSRSIVRQRFSAVICKPVFTFRFDRFNGVPADVYANLQTATATKGIVVSDPTSLKSFALKFLELLNAQCELSIAEADHKAFVPQRGALLALFNRLSAWTGLGSDEEKALANQVARTRKALRRDVEHCTGILKLFSAGVLILDEVDLILHPLRSELNWPLGKKEALDFTRSKAGDGLRWQIPFHMLDAVFYAGTAHGNDGEDYRKQTIMDLKECGRNVTDLLERIRTAVCDAANESAVLLTPHFALAERRSAGTSKLSSSSSYYRKRLAPLLAQWMLLWLFDGRRFKGVPEQDVRRYLEQPTSSTMGSALRNLSDDQMKMLNLSHNWIHSFASHVLSKINRVHFGVLTSAEIRRMEKKEMHVSQSRRLLAVPFVAKDVPSQATHSHGDCLGCVTDSAEDTARVCRNAHVEN